MGIRKLGTARQVLQIAEQKASMGEKPLYIICGESGPTGKTWLWNELRKEGHNAIEITEAIRPFVVYHDDENYMYEARLGQIIIVLNKPLRGAWKL